MKKWTFLRYKISNLYLAFGFISLSVGLAWLILSSQKNVIYVYEDEGVSPEALHQTLLTCKSLLKKYTVSTIHAQQIQNGFWMRDAVLLIMPGGADLPYVHKLNGLGNTIIRQYVQDGGSFLGICAGAYYGSSYVEFDQNGPLEVLGDRELSFFPGKAIGPILAPYDYKTNSGSRAALLQVDRPHPFETVVFYNGGCFFEQADQYPHTQTIATYENRLPAIILIDYGQGKVLLSGVHFEYDPQLLDAKDPCIQKIIEPLNQSNLKRQRLFKACMQLLGLKP